MDVDETSALRCFHGPGPAAERTKVLLFGDSLTAFPVDGYVSYGCALAEGWPGAVVEVCGFCGLEAAEMLESMEVREVEDACGQVGPGLRKLLRRADQQGQSYDMVILMAGTNDLQDMRSAPAPIATCIKDLHTTCHVEGVRTVCLSVPPNQCLKNARYHERWTRVNNLLRSWCEGEGRQEGVALYVDVQQILPYSDSTSSSLWNEDGLHFSKLGADTLGRSLLEPLRSLSRSGVGKLAAWPHALAQPMPMRLEISEAVVSAPMEPVKWLFYGDSLTAGFHAFGRLFAPYAAALGEELKLSEPHELWVCGLSGLEATELMKKKTSPQIRDAVRRTGPGIERLLSEKTFDLAFIMLGTNDLASGEDEETFNAIKKIHEACHAVKLRTVALLVPPSQAVAKFRDIADSREKVNDLLQQWAKVTPMTHSVDTGELLPFSKDSEFWEIDGLHFSRLGSRLLGQRLAQRIQADPAEIGRAHV